MRLSPSLGMKTLEFGTFQSWVIERGVGCRMRIRYWCQMLMTIHMCNLHEHHLTWIDMNLYIDAHDDISWLWPVSTSIFLHSTSDHHFPIFPTFLPTNKPGSLITVFPSQGVDKVFPPGIFLCLSYRSVCLSGEHDILTRLKQEKGLMWFFLLQTKTYYI